MPSAESAPFGVTGLKLGILAKAKAEEQLTVATEQIDSASLHTVISGLIHQANDDCTEWERRSLAEVTLSLLLRANVGIPPPPGRGVPSHAPALVDNIYDILRDFVSDANVHPETKKQALVLTKSWIENNPARLRDAYGLLKGDPSYAPFIRWSIARNWPYHVSRLGTLVDKATFGELACVLGWSRQEQQAVRRFSRKLDSVEYWSRKYRETGEWPPQEVVDGYSVSALIRGRYYQNLAHFYGGKGKYVWHPLRNYVLEPVVGLTELSLFRRRLVELYVAGMICAGAVEETDDQDIIRSWASNIHIMRSQSPTVPQEDDPEKAKTLAVNLAKQCNLDFRWKFLDKILQRARDYFVLPIIGMASGTFAFKASGSHEASLLAHSGADICIRPCWEQIAAKIDAAARHSKMRLGRLAQTGAQRVFAIKNDDLKNMD